MDCSCDDDCVTEDENVTLGDRVVVRVLVEVGVTDRERDFACETEREREMDTSWDPLGVPDNELVNSFVRESDAVLLGRRRVHETDTLLLRVIDKER